MEGQTADKWADGQTDRKKDRQTDRYTDVNYQILHVISSTYVWTSVTCLSSVLAETSLIAKELESPCSLKISLSSSTSVRGTGTTYGQQIN